MPCFCEKGFICEKEADALVALNSMKSNKSVLRVFQLSLAGAALFLTGCQHGLTIKNLDTYRNPGVVSQKPATVGLVVDAKDSSSARLAPGIAAGLRNASTEVLYPYVATGERKADVQAQVSISPTYKGSGANFFINFPGFLIFTPAWNGYVYKVDYDIAVNLTRVANSAPLGSFNLPVHLNLRHADYNRTWTEISWLEVGAIAFVGGLVFMDYDDNVSPLAADAASSTLGTYVASEIVKRLNDTPAPITAVPAPAQ